MKFSILVLLFFLTLNLSAQAYVIEREGLRLFTATEISTGKEKKIRIKGMQFGSLGVCSKPKVRLKKNVLQVRIKKTHLTKGLGSGPYFDVTLKIPPAAKKVVFGDKLVEIWPKDSLQPKLSGDSQLAKTIAQKAFLEYRPKALIDDYSVVVRKSSCEKQHKSYWVEYVYWKNGSPFESLHYRVNIETGKASLTKESEY